MRKKRRIEARERRDVYCIYSRYQMIICTCTCVQCEGNAVREACNARAQSRIFLLHILETTAFLRERVNVRVQCIICVRVQYECASIL